MNEKSDKRQSSSETSEIIELDDSVTVGDISTPEVICLDDSANQSTASIKTQNATEFLKVRAEVDLTNELTRIKDYSNTCVTIPAVTIQTKRKAENEIEERILVKCVKVNSSTPASNDTLTIEDDIIIDCHLPNLQSTKNKLKHLESQTQPSTSLSNFNGVNSSCDPNVSYALSVAAACLASLNKKRKPTARFTPYQSFLKSCAATNKLLTAGAPTNLVSEPSTKKKKRKRDKNAKNNLNYSDCILIESDPEISSNCEVSGSSAKASDPNINGFVSDQKSSLSSEAPANDMFASSETQSTISSRSKKSSCDSSESILQLDKIPLCSSQNLKKYDKEIVVIDHDDNKLQQEKSNALKIGKNVCLPTNNVSWKGLRPVIIDGSNVAFSHGLSTLGEKKFSSKGIEICVNYFKDRGHNKIIAFVPLFRKSNQYTVQPEILGKLAEEGHITFTPSRRVNAKLTVPYDDRYIVQCAVALGGVIVSSDNFRDLHEENEAWRSTIENRLLMFTFIGDMLMFPQDPLGRNGPNLDEFLRFPEL